MGFIWGGSVYCCAPLVSIHLYRIEAMSLIGIDSVARIRRLGIKGLQLDDYVMINGFIWYTILCVSFNQIASGGGSNLMTPEDIAALTPEITEDRIRGSKWVFVSEHSMILTIWSMKICMLLVYTRLT